MMSPPPAAFRGDTTASGRRAENGQQHRRAKSAVEDFHQGFVKRLAGILDDHSTVLKKNTDFLRDISSTLRTHSYSALPRPVSEPALKMNATNNTEPGDKSESSPKSMPPTPPDTPIVEITDWSSLPPVKSGESKPSPGKPSSSNTTIPANKSSDEDIAQWYGFHAHRAAKSLRYDCREVDLKLSRFIRRLNDLNGELKALDPTMSSTKTKVDATHKNLEIRNKAQQEFAAMRQTLRYYRKERATSISLATTKANEVMPGFSSLEPVGKQRALYDLYCRNKDISKPGDRKRYNDTMVIMDACIAKDLNEEFVEKIDKWEAQVESIKGDYAGNSIV